MEVRLRIGGSAGLVRVRGWLRHYAYESPLKDRSKKVIVCVCGCGQFFEAAAMCACA